MRILYVEDEKYLAEAIVHTLNKEHIGVDWASDGEQGLDLALENPTYDVIVLDIMLPKLSGFDILKTLRERKIQTPIIMLSALSEVEDKIRGLDSGADDYLAKPFKTAELIARLKALVRRPPLQAADVIKYEDLTYNPKDRTLNDTPLSEKEAAILELLLKTPDTTQSKEHILAYVWGNETFGDENYVEVYMSHLRKKLAKLSQKTEIKTVNRLGYKLCPTSQGA